MGCPFLQVAVVAVLLCGRFIGIVAAIPAQETEDSTEHFRAYVLRITNRSFDLLVVKNVLESDTDVVNEANKLLKFLFAVEPMKQLPNYDEVVKHYYEVVTQFGTVLNEALGEADNKVLYTGIMKNIANFRVKPQTIKHRKFICALNLFLFAWLTAQQSEPVTIALNVIFNVVTFENTVAQKLKPVVTSLRVNQDATFMEKVSAKLAKLSDKSIKPSMTAMGGISIMAAYQAIRNALTTSIGNLINAKVYNKEVAESAAQGLAITCFSLFYYIDEIDSKRLKTELRDLIKSIFDAQKH